ncbi:MFS transporter [Pseudoduganella ginsengisoli]|uniref:MFS transporter n=1 Tax=Pseudoduganella ginsengisoli TaxID=1462440 RepID=A0A6L6PUG2_9BURK|nr:MFS transporter [Pseudoduganella ginsengisoli]MTW00881.1 MFS transporter [Pseudoduganella ginsengisoli]
MKTAHPSPLILLACSFAFVIVQLDVTIVNVALPRIAAELHAHVAQLQWVVDAYTLGFAVFLLSAGVLGDKSGSRRAFLAGFALFTAASVACALAPTAMGLNLARAIQGVGAALLVPSSLAILNAAYGHDKPLLAKAVGWWTAAGGVSIAAGPVLGAALLEWMGWRSIFWVNVPLCLAGFWLTVRSVKDGGRRDPQRAFDWPGQILAVLGLTAFVGAVIEVHALGLQHPLVWGAFVLAGAACALFVVVESRSAAPMLPLSLFASGAFSRAVMFGVLVNFAYYGVVFIFSLYLQQLRGMGAMQAGFVFLPLTGTFILSNLASGKVVARHGTRLPMMLGALIAATGYGWLALAGIAADAPVAAMVPGLVLIPAGMGLAVPPMTTSILSAVEPRLAGTASAVLNAARQVGGALGVAVYGALAASPVAAEALAGTRHAVLVSCVLLLAAGAMAAGPAALSAATRALRQQ